MWWNLQRIWKTDKEIHISKIEKNESRNYILTKFLLICETTSSRLRADQTHHKSKALFGSLHLSINKAIVQNPLGFSNELGEGFLVKNWYISQWTFDIGSGLAQKIFLPYFALLHVGKAYFLSQKRRVILHIFVTIQSDNWRDINMGRTPKGQKKFWWLSTSVL